VVQEASLSACGVCFTLPSREGNGRDPGPWLVLCGPIPMCDVWRRRVLFWSECAGPPCFFSSPWAVGLVMHGGDVAGMSCVAVLIDVSGPVWPLWWLVAALSIAVVFWGFPCNLGSRVAFLGVVALWSGAQTDCRLMQLWVWFFVRSSEVRARGASVL